ncbi:MAG: methionine--tRNA ligase, partial [Patescibacteria group bacterium]
MSKNKFYVTTAIPYVNAAPHIGFALEAVQTDVLARYHREAGDDTYFLTGTDENALKNVQAAEKAGKDTKKFVDENSTRFENLKSALNLSFDDFIRTTEPRHVKGAQKFWQACDPADIYKKKYKGLYCVGCEEFKTKKELLEGKCPEHGTVPEEVEEENYFFKLSRYQKQLEKIIESDEVKIIPETRKNEVLSFIRGGLEDFSISRSVERAHNWGIPIPGDSRQVMYVWFDALTNYITALGYAEDG